MISGTIIPPFVKGQTVVLYRAQASGYILPPPPKNKRFWQSVQKALAVGCFMLALFGVGLGFSPFLTPWLNRNKATDQQAMTVQAAPTHPQIRNFLLTIDKIGLKDAKVIRDVDVTDEEEYKAKLKEGLAHAKGTAFPDEGKMVYIFGHSTNYPWFVKDMNALFYKLEELVQGDKIIVEFDGQKYEYFVTDKQVVKPSEVETVISHTAENVLVLQTCTPPGTFWKRLLIFARPNHMGDLTLI